ncbi:hypothetical protein IGS68_14395 [Skermanella sp. TT6]|uniref:Uncharacterized protein n=1 Tax=Skermanella cutis TaxID=2775420 RepID=A0ABX7AZ15_9PROT|nr:hypothetical protein [Skermanella sp. TT6]QQP87313.1 hypothetical protein IGS68_14395 [Skermanella sp. TT6]
MSSPGCYVARFEDGSETVRVTDPDGAAIGDDHAACIRDMLGELLDELGRRGFDASSAVFVIDRRTSGTP